MGAAYAATALTMRVHAGRIHSLMEGCEARMYKMKVPAQEPRGSNAECMLDDPFKTANELLHPLVK